MKTFRHRRAGFTLIEAMVACMLALTLGMIGFQVLRAGLLGFARNFSLNQTAGQTRSAIDHVVRKLESTVDDPQLVAFSGTQFTADASAYGKGVRFHRYISGAYKIREATGTDDVISGAGSTALHYVKSTATTLTLDWAPGTLAPLVGDRLFFLFPSDIQETVTTGGSPGNKPGRKITAVTVSGDSAVVTLSSAPGKNILANNPCYSVREGAYICMDNSTRRELRYYDNAADVTKSVKVTWDLDRNPQEKNASGVTIQPFEVVEVAKKKRVVLDLPVRVMDFNGALTRVKPTDEFNSYLRTHSQVILKNNSGFKVTP